MDIDTGGGGGEGKDDDNSKHVEIISNGNDQEF